MKFVEEYDSKNIHDLVVVLEKIEEAIANGWELWLEHANFNETEGEPLKYEWWCSLMYYTDDPKDHVSISKKGLTGLQAMQEAVKDYESYRSSRELQANSQV